MTDACVSPVTSAHVQDVIDWERILRPLCLRATWFFQVPTGGSTSSQSFQPQDAAFAKIAGAATADVSTASRLAKILVWTLRRDLTKAPSAPGGQTPLASIAGLASLLEHYYHASNSGRYSSDLADFLSSLIVQLSGSRLRWEAAPYWRGAAHVRLDPRGLAPVTEVLYGLAAVSVHHKSSAMQAAAAQALARLAYLAPQRCLPFITRCLHESLESHDAVHQIDQAITLFASAPLPPPAPPPHTLGPRPSALRASFPFVPCVQACLSVNRHSCCARSKLG